MLSRLTPPPAARAASLSDAGPDRQRIPPAGHTPLPFSALLPRHARMRVRITALKPHNTIALMAMAIIRLRDEGRDCVTQMDLWGEFTEREVSDHWRAARDLARAFQPHLFKTVPMWGV